MGTYAHGHVPETAITLANPGPAGSYLVCARTSALQVLQLWPPADHEAPQPPTFE
jgi:hypothetical protein